MKFQLKYVSNISLDNSVEMSHDDADSCKIIWCLLLLNTSEHFIGLSLWICIYTVYRLACWFSRRHDTWHPQSLAETLEEQILHHLELAHLCHPTQSQEDDCYQHDYAFIRLAMHCLQACGSAHASLPTNTFLWQNQWEGGAINPAAAENISLITTWMCYSGRKL